MDAETRVRRYGGVTLVEVTVRNDGEVPQRVAVTTALDGPVWPPRTEGLPDAGWDGERFTVRLDPGERESLGFASPAEPVDPPVRVDSEPAATDAGGAVTPRAVVRTLGDPRPPRGAVAPPVVDDGDEEGATDGEGRSDDGDGSRDPGGDGASSVDDPVSDADPAEPAPDDPSVDAPNGNDDHARASGSPADVATPPPAVAAWLSAVERRIESDDDDGGTTFGDVEGTTPTGIGAVGSPDPRRLRAVARWADRLADRAEGSTDGGGDRARVAGDGGQA